MVTMISSRMRTVESAKAGKGDKESEERTSKRSEDRTTKVKRYRIA